jgi:hypothetical protein
MYLITTTILMSCNNESVVDIYYNKIYVDSLPGKTLLEVKVFNKSNKKLFILNTSSVKKVDFNVPCNSKLLGEFAKVSYQINNNCMTREDMLLFSYIQMNPNEDVNSNQLKKKISNTPISGDNLITTFYNNMYGYIRDKPMPPFTFIESNSSSNLYFVINDNLTKQDKGLYEISWFSQQEINKIIDPGRGKPSLKNSLRGKNINGFQFYEGPFNAHTYNIVL